MIAYQSYEYAEGVANREIAAPKYVIKQSEEFIKICDGNSEKYFLDEEKLRQIDKVLKMLVMPRGLKAGCSIYECSCGYQWLFYAAILCVVHRENPARRRYETAILEIARKNFKTFTIATNLALARPLFASIGVAAGYALCSLFNFVKNKCTAIKASSDNAKEQKNTQEKSSTKYTVKKQKVAKDNTKKSSGFLKAVATVLGALSGLIIYPWAIRKNAENKVNNDKKAEFEKLYKELFDNDLKNADCYDMLAKILKSVDDPGSINNDYHYPAFFQGNEHSCIGMKFDGPSRTVSFQGKPIKLDSIEEDAVNQNFDRLVKEIKQFQANNSLHKKNNWEKSLGIN